MTVQLVGSKKAKKTLYEAILYEKSVCGTNPKFEFTNKSLMKPTVYLTFGSF